MSADANITALAQAVRCPAENVAANWPAVKTCLDTLGMSSQQCYIAALATIAVETAHTFRPIHEYGTREYFISHYAQRSDLGNHSAQDAVSFAGRGYIQITGELNYEHYGTLLGFDLIQNPDEALDPPCAAAILAAYFQERHIAEAAGLEQWAKVRKLVNGGTNGLEDFMSCVEALKHAEAA